MDKLGIPSRLRDLRSFAVNEPLGFDESGPCEPEPAICRVTPLAMPHSIPEACALLIEASGSPAVRVLHTGDFKLDEMGEFAWAELQRQPVDAVVGDSTNAQVPGRTPAERSATQALGSLLSIRSAEGAS